MRDNVRVDAQRLAHSIERAASVNHTTETVVAWTSAVRALGTERDELLRTLAEIAGILRAAADEPSSSYHAIRRLLRRLDRDGLA